MLLNSQIRATRNLGSNWQQHELQNPNRLKHRSLHYSFRSLNYTRIMTKSEEKRENLKKIKRWRRIILTTWCCRCFWCCRDCCFCCQNCSCCFHYCQYYSSSTDDHYHHSVVVVVVLLTSPYISSSTTPYPHYYFYLILQYYQN